VSGRDHGWPPEWARDLAAGGVDVDDVSLHLAIEAGAWPGPELPRAERRAFALVVLASLDARGEGATRLALPAVDARLERLGATTDDRAAVVRLLPRLLTEAALAPLVGRPGDYRPLIVDGDFLYHERDLRLEQHLAEALAARLTAPPLPAPAPPVAMREETGRWPWSAQQRAAMDAAACKRLVVISGGPGTGKTALIGGIVRTWEALGIAGKRIAIAAPTGKAANRIAELMQAAGPVPTTLHRLLGFTAGHNLRGGDFRHHENRPLPHDAIIVDEASMVGLPLMEQLARALRADARLVLLGDADQLPAVELGSVFRDLGPHAVRLTTSHRMDPGDPAGASVLSAARAIAAGDVGELLDPGRQPSPVGGFACLSPEGSAPHAGRRLIQTFVDEWYQARVKPGLETAARTFRLADVDDGFDPRDASDAAAALDRQRQARLLTVTRTGFAGSDRINAELGRRAAADVGVGGATHELAAGTPVMITRNDYDRGLFNGDQGVVLSVAAAGRPPSLAAVFARDGVLVPFPLSVLSSVLSVAYASTVHKAQGSELEHAALLLPDADLPLLSRELVYTAVTRVRRSITVVGQRALLAQAVARPLERASGLGDRIQAFRTSQQRE
jgi:exodeoxyribonuclease V alpha subunit